MQTRKECNFFGPNSEFVIYENANDDVRIGTWTDDDISFIVNGSRKATINGDGNLNVLDIVQIVSYIIGEQEFSDEQICKADFVSRFVKQIL